ncbi:MAG: DMT family transporter [Rhizobiales bacterium]|nr:DMT family transporter [Hyphomicrobiales bacterium]
MTSGQQSYGTGVTFVLLATLGWSTSGLFVRLMPELDGWQINCWRGYWLAATMLCYLAVSYGWAFPARFRAIPATALYASASCFAVGTTFYVTSLTLASTATVSVIGATSPLFAGLLSPWLTGEKPTPLAWAAALLALGGSAVIGWNGIETGRWIGILTSFGVPLTFALQTLLLRRYRHLDMMPSLFLGGVFSFVGAGLLGFTAGHAGGGFEIDGRSLLLLALMGPLQLAIPLIFYARGARSIPAIALSLIAMLDAVLNPLWPWLFVGERPESASFLGGGIILGAVLLSILGGQWMARSARQVF